MSDPEFGVVVTRENDEAAPPVYGDCSIAGICGPCEDADPNIFPLGVNVEFNSTDTSYTAFLGTDNFVQDAIRGLNDQLGRFQKACRVVFCRTAIGVDADPNKALQKTIANIMGSSLLGTGMWAFMNAAADCHVIPRLLMFPGYTGILSNVLGAYTQVNAGKGYTRDKAYPISFTNGGPDAVQGSAVAYGRADGTLSLPQTITYGAFYTSAPVVVVPPPDLALGAGGGVQAAFTVVMDPTGNPIIGAVPPILNALQANCVVESAGISKANDNLLRDSISCDRIILVSGGCKVAHPITGETVIRPRVSREIGAIIRVDGEHGGRPFHSAANQPLYGIVGPARRFSFDITRGENEGQELLANEIGILVQGEVGNDFAIADGGYITIATDNCGDDELWRLYNQVRGRDWINIALIRTWRKYLGKTNITANGVRCVEGAMNAILRDALAEDCLLGYKIGFPTGLNSADEIRKGHITIKFAAEEPPVLKRITGRGSRYRAAVDSLIAQLESQLTIAA